MSFNGMMQKGVLRRLVGAAPVCPPVSPCKGASIVSRCASCAMHKHFNAWKRLLYGWGTRLLWMETPPLRVGDMPFVDGNAAARTFGRAHRRRPYHFSCGSMSQGCRRGARRWTNMRNDWRRGARRWTKSKMIAGEVLAHGQNEKRLPANSSPMD